LVQLELPFGAIPSERFPLDAKLIPVFTILSLKPTSTKGGVGPHRS
jgi:hypothetical protein